MSSQNIENFWLIVLVIAVIAVANAVKSHKKGRKRGKSNFKYDPKASWPFSKAELLSNAEKEAFKKLQTALPEHYIFSQVQLSQLVTVRKGHDFNQWFNRINRMSVDFVVSDSDLKTVAAVEIDDATHRDPKRMEADAKKAKVLKAANIPLVRYEARNLPGPLKIREQVVGPEQKATSPESKFTATRG